VRYRADFCFSDVKLLILHEHKHDDGIRNFFYDVWELLVKVSKDTRPSFEVVLTKSTSDR
jgi:UTP:GlnB (protein PII) uridylyltransferase